MSISYLGTKASPQRVLLAGFIVVIAIGTILLMLPIATTGGISFTDALFTSTSSVCVTGLIVKDTPSDFTSFGLWVVLVLIQIGGLGYMSMASWIALIAGRRIGIAERIVLSESLSAGSLEGIVGFMKRLVWFVFIIELTGCLVLTARFSLDFPFKEAAFKGVFHAISAFNNAGFSLFSDSLMGYRGDTVINVAIMVLIILGGIGFVVMDNSSRRISDRGNRLTLHSKLVLTSSLVLVLAGAVLFFVGEAGYFFNSMDTGMIELVHVSLFASVTARTAGFSTVDYSILQPATIFLTICLMLVGASPGSTGGGVKTTTISVIAMHLWQTLRGRRDTVVFKQRVPESMIARAFVILALSVFFVIVVTFIIIEFEHSAFMRTLFEVVSAFATVGLSFGDGGSRSLAATFSNPSKWMIIMTMFTGRLGPITLLTALLRQREERVRYPEGRIIIG
jgi:trk system potassium uptake protein TrkH